MNKPLYMIKYDSESDFTLSPTNDPRADYFRHAKPSEITLYSMAEMLDQDAENGNERSFVGVHCRLAEILRNRLFGQNSSMAKRIMRDIVNAGGLHNMR